MTTPIYPDVILHRVRMAITEAGYPAEAAWLSPLGHCQFDPGRVPIRVMWKAHRLIGLEPALCLGCFDYFTDLECDVAPDCADPTVDDCGTDHTTEENR